MRTYANGMLYSILELESIKKLARSRGLSELLTALSNHQYNNMDISDQMANNEQSFATQLSYIKERLLSDAIVVNSEEIEEEEEDFEDGWDFTAIVQEELNNFGEKSHQFQDANEFILKKYIMKKCNNKMPLTRPTTPYQNQMKTL